MSFNSENNVDSRENAVGKMIELADEFGSLIHQIKTFKENNINTLASAEIIRNSHRSVFDKVDNVVRMYETIKTDTMGIKDKVFHSMKNFFIFYKGFFIKHRLIERKPDSKLVPSAIFTNDTLNEYPVGTGHKTHSMETPNLSRYPSIFFASVELPIIEYFSVLKSIRDSVNGDKLIDKFSRHRLYIMAQLNYLLYLTMQVKILMGDEGEEVQKALANTHEVYLASQPKPVEDNFNIDQTINRVLGVVDRIDPKVMEKMIGSDLTKLVRKGESRDKIVSSAMGVFDKARSEFGTGEFDAGKFLNKVNNGSFTDTISNIAKSMGIVEGDDETRVDPEEQT